MGRNYWEEINELKERNMEYENELKVLEISLRTLRRNRNMYFPSLYEFKQDDLYKSIDKLKDEIYKNQCKIDRLRAAYRRQHSKDFYREMDNIDILNEIAKNGFIIAVKF